MIPAEYTSYLTPVVCPNSWAKVNRIIIMD